MGLQLHHRVRGPLSFLHLTEIDVATPLLMTCIFVHILAMMILVLEFLVTTLALMLEIGPTLNPK